MSNQTAEESQPKRRTGRSTSKNTTSAPSKTATVNRSAKVEKEVSAPQEIVAPPAKEVPVAGGDGSPPKGTPTTSGETEKETGSVKVEAGIEDKGETAAVIEKDLPEGEVDAEIAEIDIVEEQGITATETPDMGEETETLVVMPPVDEDLETEGQTPTVEADKHPEKQIQPAPYPSSGVSLSQVFFIALACSLVTLVLALVISMGILAGLNAGRLQYALPADIDQLSMDISGLEKSTGALAGDLSTLRTRVDNLDALSGRVTDVEGMVAAMKSDIDAAITQVESLDQQVGALTGDVETLQAQSTLYQGFFSGLQKLLDDVFTAEE